MSGQPYEVVALVSDTHLGLLGGDGRIRTDLALESASVEVVQAVLEGIGTFRTLHVTLLEVEGVLRVLEPRLR